MCFASIHWWVLRSVPPRECGYTCYENQRTHEQHQSSARCLQAWFTPKATVPPPCGLKYTANGEWCPRLRHYSEGSQKLGIEGNWERRLFSTRAPVKSFSLLKWIPLPLQGFFICAVRKIPYILERFPKKGSPSFWKTLDGWCVPANDISRYSGHGTFSVGFGLWN